MKRKKIIQIIGILSLIVILVITGSLIFRFTSKKTYSVTDRLKEFQNAKSVDKETVGWLFIPGTNIDYPVHLGNQVGSENEMDTIWTNDTLDEKDGTKNRQVILGHNILNITSQPLINGEGHTRFEPLMGYVYKSFTEDHLYIQYTNEYNETSLYKIYSIRFYKIGEDDGQAYESEEDLKKYIAGTRKESIYDFDVDVLPTDRLLTLSTCTRYNGLTGATQFKVDARKVRKNEKSEKYAFKTNKNYDIIEESRK